MPSRLEKCRSYAEHLLDAFLKLRGTYAMLEPLIYDEEISQRVRVGQRLHGASILTSALLHSCILGVAKLARDNDERTPSVGKLVDTLTDTQLVSELRESYSVLGLTPKDGFTPEVLALLEKSERREEVERRARFDELVKELGVKWTVLDNSSTLASFRKMRDQLIAHNQLFHDADGYRVLDVSTLGIKIDDVPTVMVRLQECVDLVNLVFRASSFDFEMLDAQLSKAGQTFWAAARDV